MEFHEIRYFLTLSRTLNFTKAAEECHVTQSALSRAIRKMEDELGGLLFSRERTNMHLTELGRLIGPHLTEALAHAGAAKQTAARFLKLEEANLTVGVMCTIAPVHFVSFMNRFRADNPGVEITLLDDVPDRICDKLVKGELDIALMALPVGFPTPLRATELYSERFVIACSPGHRFATMSEVPVAELDGEFYLSRKNCEFYDVLAEICRTQGANLVFSYQSEREDWILTMVAAGLGVCFLPEYTATFPGVVGCPVVSPSIERKVCLVTRAGRRPTPPLTAFVQAARRYPWRLSDGARPVRAVPRKSDFAASVSVGAQTEP